MKKSLLLLAVFVFSIGSLMAQDKIVDSDYCILQDGAVVQYVDGKPAPISAAITLNNGTKVNPDGTYMAGNKSSKLTDGQCFGMSGKMYKSETHLYAAVQKKKKKLYKKIKN